MIEPILRRAAINAGEREPAAKLDEAIGLARAIDLEVEQSGIVMLNVLRPATYLGTGKVEEISGLVKSVDASIVVMDCALSPVQQRNLERAWDAKVLDRTGLILEIFGRRARTREGALQVEHAHLTYQKSRLVRSWTHLERQRGGFGFLGGPGETQLEADRRMIDERLRKIEGELATVKRTRALHRVSRRRVPYPIVAFVGYTNAGKSTLFNRMTQASVLSADMLFATLDPTLRAMALPHGARIILSDTVGFISEPRFDAGDDTVGRGDLYWPFHGYGRCPPRARETPAGSAGETRAENAVMPGEVGRRLRRSPARKVGRRGNGETRRLAQQPRCSCCQHGNCAERCLGFGGTSR